MVYTWTVANFEGYPIQTDKIGQVYLRVQDTRKAVAERIRNEHCLADNLDADHGRHNTGSARSFVFRGTVPTGVPAAADAGTTDFSQGRVALSVTGAELSRDYKLFVYEAAYGADAAGWKALSYLDFTSAQTVGGLKTFSTLPKTEIATAWASAANENILPMKTINDYLQGAYKDMVKTLIPAGFTYVQYPGTLPPATLYAPLGFTWTDITATFVGSFFRAYALGVSYPFDGGIQNQQLYAHSHSITPTTATFLGTVISTGIGADRGTNVPLYPVNEVTTVNRTDDAGSGAELRPANMSILIWKRK